ncbi:sugar phosphate isomerase/epimerase [Nanchangia anserum]|uniref:Sugar phosphate isomerase/epimerase n=1 Tax=Nanchangia anserum TaxID=2692125 RepID=A0A8I0GF70_9ACTO|nr:sugar phosphate isomerase/epimerase family protein [Nanchangia anserum]MBD3689727.1 sugar phosphate isomerase/epimerase [Nanchangia anserum]QOX81898.1 sugar phosphate isomerase/epimerase [Nanchangia anserum]
MSRTITLFTGQWVDLPFREVCRLAHEWGYDGLEVAASGDHLDVFRAAEDDDYVASFRATLEEFDLKLYAISNHSTGQCVCDDPIDFRHRGLLSARTWGDGDPEGVRQRAAEEMKVTAKAAARVGAKVVTGFTGSKIWPYVAMYPPVGADVIEAGYQDFADRWNPIIDAFDEAGVKFALEVHPSEIAYDYWTTKATLDAIGHRENFGINWDPSHMLWQGLDPAVFLADFADRIYHVHVKDTKLHFDGRNGRLSSHLPWGGVRRGWNFVSAGLGDADFERYFRTLDQIGYAGPLSVEWEDAGMDRLEGAPKALAFARAHTYSLPEAAFDSAFKNR